MFLQESRNRSVQQPGKVWSAKSHRHFWHKVRGVKRESSGFLVVRCGRSCKKIQNFTASEHPDRHSMNLFSCWVPFWIISGSTTLVWWSRNVSMRTRFRLFILIYGEHPVFSLCDLFIPNFLHSVTDSQQCSRNLNSRTSYVWGKKMLTLFQSLVETVFILRSDKKWIQTAFQVTDRFVTLYLDKNAFSYSFRYFRENPKPFFVLAKELYPGNFREGLRNLVFGFLLLNLRRNFHFSRHIHVNYNCTGCRR